MAAGLLSAGTDWFCDYARAISFRSLNTFSMCSKHSRRSWREARPASAGSNPSDLAAADAWRFVNAPQMRRARWRSCSSNGADAAMGNMETSSAPSSSRLLTRSQPLVQSAEESKRRMERRSRDRKRCRAGTGQDGSRKDRNDGGRRGEGLAAGLLSEEG